MPIHFRMLASLIVLASATLAADTAGQQGASSLSQFVQPNVRVVFGADQQFDPTLPATLVDLVKAANGAFPGLAGHRVTDVTVSVVDTGKGDHYAYSFPDNHVIVLVLDRLEELSERELLGVIRHELAHLALHDHVASRALPFWLIEGYAEWARGEPSCQSTEMIRVFLRLYPHRAESLSLSFRPKHQPSRLDYALFASAVQHLRLNVHFASFLDRAATAGFEEALRSSLRTTPNRFVHEWKTSLLVGARSTADQQRCSPR